MPKRDRRTDRIAVSISRVGIDVLARDENIVSYITTDTCDQQTDISPGYFRR